MSTPFKYSVVAHAFEIVDDTIESDLLRKVYKRIIVVNAARERLNIGSLTLCDVAKWLDDSAEQALQVVYALRVADYPRTQARSRSMLDAHERLKEALEAATIKSPKH